ncbi:hypothetical protein SAMN04488072_102300 [Lentibacillus halodurans]|uniref:Uncharacterized protein n=2 Tax=Lentibacillus halodurans TaxID=237679 RepID=A0A1I0WAH4_9BACI|nr:hypothetical protein SAMN04488072_102300 [Lentibacillus halodurans]
MPVIEVYHEETIIMNGGGTMDKKKRKSAINRDVTAPGMDPEDAYGVQASETDIKKGESTKVTRLSYDEYEPSENE